MLSQATAADHHSLTLDVAGLQFVDQAGLGLLHDLERRGARLVGCSGFVTELLGRGPAPSAAAPAHVGQEGDVGLLDRLRAGDARAFETLVRHYGGRMLTTARRIVGTEDEARDVVQEAFMAAFRAIDTFAGAARVSTWLHRIVVNAALMKLRSRRRRKEEAIEDLLPRFDDEGRWLEAPAPFESASDALLERQETRTRVRQAIERLPESYRTVLVLRDIEELDTDEVASILGVTPNTVKTRLHRARQALRTILLRELPGAAVAESAAGRA